MESIFSELNTDYVVLIVFVVIMLLVFVSLFFFSEKKKIIRFLNKLPYSSIASLKIGEYSKIIGVVQDVNEAFIAPLSKRKCVFYAIKIEQKIKNRKNFKWIELVKDENIQEFIIEKNGNVVLIEPSVSPKNYRDFLSDKYSVSLNTFKGSNSEVDSLLKKYNLDKVSLLRGNKRVRLSETIIEIGDEVTVAGLVNSKELKKAIKGYSYSKIFAFESFGKQKLIITDLFTKKRSINL